MAHRLEYHENAVEYNVRFQWMRRGLQGALKAILVYRLGDRLMHAADAVSWCLGKHILV